MPTPLTRTLALILSLTAATWALQRPATHSLARRRGTPLLAAKDARRAAPLLTVARREGQLSRMQNVEGWRGNNGRWRKYEEIKECAAGRRSYVPVCVGINQFVASMAWRSTQPFGTNAP